MQKKQKKCTRNHYCDAFVANSGGQPNILWLNSGNGTASFVDSGQDLGNGNSEAVALGDIDHDGDLDVFFLNP